MSVTTSVVRGKAAMNAERNPVGKVTSDTAVCLYVTSHYSHWNWEGAMPGMTVSGTILPSRLHAFLPSTHAGNFLLFLQHIQLSHFIQLFLNYKTPVSASHCRRLNPYMLLEHTLTSISRSWLPCSRIPLSRHPDHHFREFQLNVGPSSTAASFKGQG